MAHLQDLPSRPSFPGVAAVVATKDRPAALANRALKSIAAQTWAPDFLIVADDSDRRHRDDNRRIVNDAPLPRTRVKYLENDRTQGACGAWNVALDWLHRELTNPDAVFVAMLDDDDAWEPDHLDVCLRAAAEKHLDMVAADILRHEAPGDEGTLNAAPAELRAEDFLVGNPNIQGSNLFVRLGTLVAAGLFDEGLASTTDRDLCIRIADLGGVRYARVPRALVHHHAYPASLRLSTPGSPAKIKGLTSFWRKYRGRMDEERSRAFHDRATTLFGWTEPASPAPPSPNPGRSVPPDEQRLALIVGIAVSSARAGDVIGLLDDLCLQREDPRLVSLEVVVLENGPRDPGGAAGIERVVSWLRARGVGCFLAPIERQSADATAGIFGRAFERGAGCASIAVARTMLKMYCYELAKRRPGAVVWILDEDMRLENLVWRAGTGVARERVALVDPLVRLRSSGVAVAIGTVTGAPPLPFASCARTQLVDAYHNLEWLAALDPEASLPDRSAENMAERMRCDDYYYDLSRRGTDHLESPFWYVPLRRDCTAREALGEMVARLPRILAGEEVFRPLILDAAIDPVELRKPSVHCGGNAFIFDIEALREYPNVVPAISGQSTRRSDMVWSLLNRYAAGRAVVKVPLGVFQDRSQLPEGALDLNKLCRDIQGYAVYSALEDLLLSKLEERRQAGQAGPPDQFPLVDDDVIFAIKKFRKYVRERTAAFSLSFHRAAGLARVLDRYVDPRQRERFWWLRDKRCADAVAGLMRFVDVLRREFDLARLPDFQRMVADVPDDVVREYIGELRDEVEARRDGMGASACRPWIDAQRVQNAFALLASELGVESPRLLGVGAEAVVLTDDVTVYKCIDYWKSRTPDAQIDFLRSQVGRWAGLRSLYTLTSVRAQGARVVLTYRFEPTEPYRGGHGDGLLQLLRDCHGAGIVCSNVHPDNLVVADGAVKLIDYGSDLHPYSDEGFLRMARRAFLTWRCRARPDLKDLMRRSIDDEAMPELEGFARFHAAIDPPGKEALLDARLTELVGARAAASLLDYGCGRGKLAIGFAQRGWDVVAYDPDPALAESWRRQEHSGVRFLGASDLSGLRASHVRFDTVVCSLVLCTLADAAFRGVLADLRTLVNPRGVVVIAVCNPRFVGAQTTLQRRELPAGRRTNEVFEYAKVVRSTGARRVDIHRPEALYRRLLREAGLAVEVTQETPGTDVETFEYASDFLILGCRPNRTERTGRTR
ncbi:MAG: methyltransferase domain-containing protein [Deltaproteobacteria bacterium]|nr:methyltransferase domain-containing protein [Deltaproteobacteria bacterium]